jgi:RHS repeat-associated protein
LSAEGFDGDPVNTADGDYSESIPIVSIPGLGPDLSFTATYDSKLAQSEVTSGTTSPGPLGWGWSANDSMTLVGAGGTGEVTLDEEGGAEIPFLPQPSGELATGGTCTTSGSVQCFSATEGDVTAVLQENIGTPDTYQFSRDNSEVIDTFNASGQLSAITNSNGYAVEFAYGVTTGTNCSTSGTSCETEKEYNTGTGTWGRELDIVFTTPTGLISKVVDPAGRTWSFSYDSNDNLIGITNPRILLESFGYDSGSANPTMVHDLTSLTTPNGQTTGPDPGAALTISYEETSTSSQAPLGYVISQSDPEATYQGLHSGSPNGITTSFAYSGNSMGETGSTITTTTTGSTNATIAESEDEYVQGVLVAHVDGLNTSQPETTTYQRNALDLPTSVTDAKGHTTTYSYDANGNVLSSTDALGNTWTYTYSSFNELLTSTPPTGSAQTETVNTYDSAGNQLTSAVQPSSGTDLTTTNTVCESSTCTVGSNSYSQGEIEKTTDPRGNATSFTYDIYGDLTSVTDPLGDETTNAYTSIGQLYCSTSPKATAASVVCPSSSSTRTPNTTSATFDLSDTLVATTTDPNGNTTDYTYDPDGNQTVSQDPIGNQTVTAFDADDRPISVTNGSGSSAQTVTTTAYDVVPSSTNADCSSTAVPTATSCTDVIQAEGTGSGSLNAKTAYYYDAFNNLVQTTDPGGEVTANTYDLAGNLSTKTTGAGTTTYGYQSNNWLSTEAFSGATSGFSTPSSSTSFTYYGDGARHTMTDSTGTTTYGYDLYGRVKSVVDGAGNKVTYGYNLDGEVNCLTYPSSGALTCQNGSSGTGMVTYGYDNADRMSSLTDWNSAKITFGYNTDSDLISTTYPTTAATSVTQTFDNADNLLKQTTTNVNLSGGSQSNTWTPNADNLLATTKANSGTANAYGYNALTQVTTLAGSDSYTYDQLGRMASDTVGSTTANYGYTSDSALCWSGTGTGTCASPPTGANTYGSNAIDARCYSTTSTSSGTCTSPPSGSTTQSYGYNQLGELTCATGANSSNYTCANTNASATTTYGYNGDGLRMSDTPAGGSSQQFTWDVTPSIPDLLSDGTNSYVYGPSGTPVEQIVTSTSAATYLVSDPTGVRYQVNASGTIAGTKTYNPYGKCSSCSGSTPIGFEDGYTDPNGLIDLVYRYYDPATDQFISVDPLVSQTGQPFSYAGDDPVNDSDPTGLHDCGWTDPLGCAGNAAQSVAHVANQDVLPVIHTVSGVVAAGASICAILTSETIIGGATCGAIALSAAAVNVASSDVLYAEGRESGTVLALDAVGGAFAGTGSAFEAAGTLAEAAGGNAEALSESWRAEMESASLLGKVAPWARSGYYGLQAAAWGDLAESLSAGSKGAAALGFGLASAALGLGNSNCG